MGAIADLNQLVNTLTGGTAAKEQIWWNQDNRQGAAAGAATVAGQFTSLWTFNGLKGTGVAPGITARIPTRTTIGTLTFTNPSGGRQKYLVGFMGQVNVPCVYLLYDRLADISGLSAVATAAQTTTGLAVTRYTGTESVGNQIFLEIYVIIGTTATTATVSYTNQDGISGRTSKAVVFGGTNRREATRFIHVPLQDGDTGVRSVESVTVAATTGTIGDFGVTIVRMIATLPIGIQGTGCLVDCLTQMPSLPEIKTDAALTFAMFASTTGAPGSFGSLSFVEA